MTTTYRALAIIGAEIKYEDLFVPVQDSVKWECSYGHRRPAGSTGQFCSECGGRYRESFDSAPIPKFTAYARAQGRGTAEVWDEWEEEFETGEVCAYRIRERGPWILGFRISSIDSYSLSDSGAFSREDLEKTWQDAEALLKETGLDNHPVKLFTVLDVG